MRIPSRGTVSSAAASASALAVYGKYDVVAAVVAAVVAVVAAVVAVVAAVVVGGGVGGVYMEFYTF